MTNPTLQRFLASLENRLTAMPTNEVHARLLNHARSLPPDERVAFLDIFAARKPTNARGGAAADERRLLNEIDAFVGRLSQGAYFLGYGWDDAMHEERSFGDESWVFEMDAFFAEAGRAFTSGRLVLARSAYERLLEAFRLDDEVGTFSGPLTAVKMVRTDLEEAHARYLRAVYETTAPGERAGALASVWFDQPGARSTILRAVRETLPVDLPGLGDFLPAWVAQLRSIEGRGRGVRALITEAVEMLDGVDGLSRLAREPGPTQAERFLDWVEALRRDGRDADAKAAAEEALGALPPRGEVRARIAEHLAELEDDDGARLEARRAAWRSAPGHDRLVALVDAARALRQVREVSTAELAAIGEATGELAAIGGRPAEDGRLVASLVLLAGRVDEAIGLLGAGGADARPRGVDGAGARPRGARGVVLPYLLAAGCGGPVRDEWGSMAVGEFLTMADRAEEWSWRRAPHGSGRRVRPGPGPNAGPIAGALAGQIAASPAGPGKRRSYLEIARREMTNDIAAIVGGKVRARYEEAAWLAVALAEALSMEIGPAAGTNAVETIRDAYSRHVAFQDALRKELKEARHVSAPPERRKR